MKLRIFGATRNISRVSFGYCWPSASNRNRDLASSTGAWCSPYSTGPVDNENLRALYSGAALLLFPSLQEGFGWPIVEAQACGCLVATTNRAPMTAVGGQGDIYFDVSDACGAAAAITRAWGVGIC
ncbi:glycosyltransferase [Acidithiobacillus ferrivorans]